MWPPSLAEGFNVKNSTYGRHRISQHVQIIAPIPKLSPTGQKWTEIVQKGQKRTEIDINKQKPTETDKESANGPIH